MTAPRRRTPNIRVDTQLYAETGVVHQSEHRHRTWRHPKVLLQPLGRPEAQMVGIDLIREAFDVDGFLTARDEQDVPAPAFIRRNRFFVCTAAWFGTAASPHRT